MKQVHILFLSLLFLVSTGALAQSRQKKKAIQTVIQTAHSFQSVPYKYGGTSRSGIDCSALMQASFQKAGYSIPRTAKKQLKCGKRIGKKRIQPGDLVCFRFKKKGKRWYHSGLITQVKGNKVYFIHASSSKGVTISDLHADYYKKNIKGFRRII